MSTHSVHERLATLEARHDAHEDDLSEIRTDIKSIRNALYALAIVTAAGNPLLVEKLLNLLQ